MGFVNQHIAMIVRVAAAAIFASIGSTPSALAEDKYSQAMTRCSMVYNLKGWSVGYSTSRGEGAVTCDKGQKAEVVIETKGGGLTVGKSEIIGGKGSFSGVRDIGDLYGGYGAAEAHAGAGKSTKASVVTKGEISLTLAGTGQGVNFGVSVGSFIIRPKPE